jgi:uncharacterized OsmC-like protein
MARGRTYSGGALGRAPNGARRNQFVADDLAAHGGPGDAINAAELFLSELTVCAVLMMERLARASHLPLQKADVTVECSIDTEAIREGPAVLDWTHMRFELVGVNDAQAKEMVTAYKRQ